MKTKDDADCTFDMESLTLIEAVCAFEGALRRLHPMAVQSLRQGLTQRVAALESLCRSLKQRQGETRDEDAASMVEAAGLLVEAIERFGLGDDMTSAFLSALSATRPFCKAHEVMFGLAGRVRGLARLFVEGGLEARNQRAGLVPKASGTLVHRYPPGDPYARGGYSLFVPGEGPGGPRLLVVALHGGMGHGRDFLWTWQREASSRGFILLAPTSQGRTWSLENIADDAGMLMRHLDEVCAEHDVDTSRILVTGVSDGGSFALGFGLGRWLPGVSIAPVACVLPGCDITGARGTRILWVQGALDWMFPVARAAKACEDLSRSGADVRLRIIPDLAHAYPREENDAILNWFGIGRERGRTEPAGA